MCYYIGRCFCGIGLWLSLVERCVRDAEVAGSNPVNPTMVIKAGGILPPAFFVRDGRIRAAGEDG